MPTIEEIMTPTPLTLQENASLAEAATMMRENNIRHIPIVADALQLVGLVTQRDLLAAAHGPDQDQTVSSIMRRKVYTVSEKADLRSAALMIQQYKIGALPVVSDDKLIGIITDSDYVGLAINLLEQLIEIEEDVESYDDTG